MFIALITFQANVEPTEIHSAIPKEKVERVKCKAHGI